MKIVKKKNAFAKTQGCSKPKRKMKMQKSICVFGLLLGSYNCGIMMKINVLEKNENAKIAIYQNQKEKCFCKKFFDLKPKRKMIGPIMQIAPRSDTPDREMIYCKLTEIKITKLHQKVRFSCFKRKITK